MSEEHYIAYHGFAFLKGATDSHKTGLQIQLRLEHEKDYRVFKEFRKHRKGKAGSGLYRVLTKAEGAEEWYGPVDLKFLRWTVSSANGAVVTFEMEDPVEWRKMRDAPALDAGYGDHELRRVEMMVLELDQENKPINVEQRAKLEKMAAKRKWPKGGPRSKQAARLGHDEEFRKWVSMLSANELAACTPEFIGIWIRRECDIDSRAQLDHDPAALQRFEDRVYRPFLRNQM